MHYSLTLVVAIVCLTPSIYPAPMLRNPPADVYFSVKPGTRNVYKVDDDWDHVEVIRAVEIRDGVTIVTVCEDADGELIPASSVAVTTRELRLTSYKGEKLEQPIALVKLPAKSGDQWDVGFATKTMRVKGKATVKGIENVEVPAGKFKAIRVDWAVSVNGADATIALWYAPGVGEVKEVFGLVGPESRPHIRVLTSVTLGKD